MGAMETLGRRDSHNRIECIPGNRAVPERDVVADNLEEAPVALLDRTLHRVGIPLASLAAARERHNVFEAALTILSLIELDRLEGVEPPLEMLNESRSLLASLKVRAVPPVPRPAQ